MLDLIRVLTLTVEAQDSLEDLFGRIVVADLIPASKFPKPKAFERKPPREIGGLLVTPTKIKVKVKPKAVRGKAGKA